MNTLGIRLRSLAVFRALLGDPVIAALCDYLDGVRGDCAGEAMSRYGQLVSLVYDSADGTLARHILRVVSESENPHIRMVGRGEVPGREMECCVREELAVLQAAADLTPAELRRGLDWDGWLPEFPVETVDIASAYREVCGKIGQRGYGIYAAHGMFRVDAEQRIVPVRTPDPIRLSSLVDYQREQRMILDNTLALLAGRPAANILLTGDAGTGKSSTVKAVANELYDRGVRIVELRREQLDAIPEVLAQLGENPLKFILFIDDLSFRSGDDSFSALKAVLEGSVCAKTPNVVIYATSNRRHLVKEQFSQRDGDDIHRNDTMQEILSLSERFGIQITFRKPDRQTYLDIVRHLARERGVECDGQELEMLAERFALSRGGRSARGASQFVDSLASAEKA